MDMAALGNQATCFVSRTNPPGKYVVLYDGHCQFCARQSKRLVALARPGAVVAVDFQQPGALDPFPGISHEACMQAMHLVTPAGHVFRGFEAIVGALATRRIMGLVAYPYYLPGVRQICDRLYRFVASHRYQFWGRHAETNCQEGTCAVHFQNR